MSAAASAYFPNATSSVTCAVTELVRSSTAAFAFVVLVLCRSATKEAWAADACIAEEASTGEEDMIDCSKDMSCCTVATATGSFAKNAGEARILFSVWITIVYAAE